MRKIVFLLALWAVVAAVPGVRAQPQFDFGIGAAASGSMSYGGGSDMLHGTGITVNEVAGKGGVPSNNGLALAVTGGLLSFTTGPSNGLWSWQPGGSLSITGAIPAQTPPGGTAFAGTSGTLLTGNVVSATVVAAPGNTFLVAIGAFLSSTNSAILSYYGFSSPPSPTPGFFNLSFTVSGGATPGGAFTSTTMGSGDVTGGAVPAPGFLVLLCSGGAATLLGYGWRRVRA